MDERYRRMHEPTFDEWVEDVRAAANRRGWHAVQRHVERVIHLQGVERLARTVMLAPNLDEAASAYVNLRALLTEEA